jgi:beta-glucosidase
MHLFKKPQGGLLIVCLFLGLVVWYSIYVFLHTEIPELPENPLYQNSDVPLALRVTDLLSHMTLEEKIGQMALVEKNSLDELADIRTYGLGGILSGFGGKPDDNTAAGWKNMIGSFISESRSSRLGIPVLYGVDAIHGHSNVPGATVFPHFIGLGASGDEQLVEAVARATADELLATGVRWSYSPTYDLPEDIRWGRVYETFSDDPLLVSKLGSAYIRGLQENPSRPSSTIAVLATPKHYIGAGSMRWNSSSNKNFTIDQGLTPIDEEKLRRHYLPPFEKAVETGALSVMAGLNSWGDTKLAASSYLIQTVLKEELGFQGFVVSDWYGVYEIPGSDYAAAVTAINAGVDMVMLPFDYEAFIKNVRRAVNNGEISEARIDDAVARILTAKFQLGLFDTRTGVDATTELGSPAHRALAREAAAKSLVLLKNDNGLLPLKTNIRTIRVAGSAADDVGKQAGAWTVEWQGIAGNWLPGATSILAGIRASAPVRTTIEFDIHANFSLTAPKADLGIAIVGESPYAEGWGDTPLPILSTEDRATIERLTAVCDAVLVVLVTGRPLIVTHEIPDWNTVVVAWLPGSEGAGVADVLFGKKPFTGKLPLPWPATTEQLPIMEGKTADGSLPLFPRYFGLPH